MVAVKEEPQRTATGGGVVDHLCHEAVVLAEAELVADTDFAGRIYQHVPKTGLGIQLAQQEDADLGAGLLLLAIQQGGEHARVVHHEQIAFVKIVDDILEKLVLDGLSLAIKHHQTGFVPLSSGVQGYQFLRKIILEF